MTPLSWFHAAVIATALFLPPYAWARRGRPYAIFALVILLLSLPGAVALHARLVGWATPGGSALLTLLFAWGMTAAGTHLAALVTPRLRSRPFRLGLSVPGMTFIATGALAGLWLLALAPVRGIFALAGWPSPALLGWLDLVPIAIGLLSVTTSSRLSEETVRLRRGDERPDTVTRLPLERFRGGAPAPIVHDPVLRIVQIADPHLGPWQPEALLERRIAQLVADPPDLVLLTGDFLTMEGNATRGALARALRPLAPLAGRTYAVFGNHDHEAPDEVAHALAANGIRLLIDAEAVAATPVGAVQIVGADWVYRDRSEHIRTLLARYPRRPGHLRLLLLHDPSVFRHVPPGDVDLTLSGHTHGGQVGLVSLGLAWTVLSRTGWPDHGYFGLGASRLYVHRGTGFYGFPLRVGVPGEASRLELVLDHAVDQ